METPSWQLVLLTGEPSYTHTHTHTHTHESLSLSLYRLRALIDTALLSFLSTNNTQLILSFPQLVFGGVYLNRTSHTHLVVVITTSEEGKGDLVIGEMGGGGDVDVEIDGDIDGPIQVS